MSQENVETFKRAVEANNRRDVEALLDELDPEVEWHPGLPASLGGEATVYRGEEGVRGLFRDLYESFAKIQMEFSEIRDLDDRIVAIGRIHTCGGESGAETTSPWAYLIEFKNAKAVRIRTYLDPAQALDAAGLPG